MIEGLESRIVLYSATGNAWPNPQVISISFMPDGTNLGGGYTSNLMSTFNAKSSLGNWENTILQAAQTWAQQTNINFTLVSDNGAAEGSGPDEQGSPGFGDIRIGGYSFGSSTLALTYQPPSGNNFSIAGDMTFNTGQSFNIGSTYDLYTVAMHEFGHALGLDESSVSTAVEYASYTAKKTGLASDDISGIRSIYSNNAARTTDAYNTSSSSNGTVNTAAALTISGLPTLVPNLDITTAGQLEYFSFTAPSGAGSTLALDLQSSGLSLLAPKVTIYGANGTTVLGSASGAGLYGTTLTVNVSSVTAGEKFYVEAQGADSTAMGTGRYALGLNFSGATPPTEASPVIAEAAGSPQHAGSGQADGSSWRGYGIGGPVIAGISPDNGDSASDGITNATNISLTGSAPYGDTVTLYENGKKIGYCTALMTDTWIYTSSSLVLANGSYSFTAMATDSSGNSTQLSAPYAVVIDTHVPKAPVLSDISPDTGASSTDGITNVNAPTFSGTSEPFAVIDLYANGNQMAFGTTKADITGHWSFTVGGPGEATSPESAFNIRALVHNTSASISSSSSKMPDGAYSVTATAMDIAGTTSVSSTPLAVVIDTETPVTPVITGGSNAAVSTSAGSLVMVQQQSITGTSQSGTTLAVMLNGTFLSNVIAGANGTWTCNLASPLTNGTYRVTTQATDVAGNVSEESATYTWHITSVSSPLIAGVSLVSTKIGLLGLGGTQQSLSIIGTAAASESVQVYLSGTLLGTVATDASGNWSYQYVPTTSTVANGVYRFSAVASDAYGNFSAPASTFSLQVGGGLTANTPRYSAGTLSGVATANSTVMIVDGNTVIGSVAASASGAWSFTPKFTKGNHSIAVESGATNGSSYVGVLSTALSVTV